MSKTLTTIKDVFIEAISFIGILLIAVLFAIIVTILFVIVVPIIAIVIAILTGDSLVGTTFECYNELIKGIRSQPLNDDQETES